MTDKIETFEDATPNIEKLKTQLDKIVLIEYADAQHIYFSIRGCKYSITKTSCSNYYIKFHKKNRSIEFALRTKFWQKIYKIVVALSECYETRHDNKICKEATDDNK